MKCPLSIFVFAALSVSTVAPGALAGPWDDDPARVHVALRSGMRFVEDAGFDVISEAPFHAMGQVEVSAGLTPSWWLGLSFGGGAVMDTVHDDIDTRFASQTLQLYGEYRHHLLPALVAFGRLGPEVSWTTVSLDTGTRTLEQDDWTLGVHAALGLEFLPVHGSIIQGLRDPGDDFGFGVTVAATYERLLPLDLTAGGTTLGRLDPSGPGWLLGMALQF